MGRQSSEANFVCLPLHASRSCKCIAQKVLTLCSRASDFGVDINHAMHVLTRLLIAGTSTDRE